MRRSDQVVKWLNSDEGGLEIEQYFAEGGVDGSGRPYAVEHPASGWRVSVLFVWLSAVIVCSGERTRSGNPCLGVPSAHTCNVYPYRSPRSVPHLGGIVPVSLCGCWISPGFWSRLLMLQLSGDYVGKCPRHREPKTPRACTAAVRQRLADPAGGDFPLFTMASQVQYIGTEQHVLTSYVDTTNAFGAAVRINYRCVVNGSGSDLAGYRVASLEIG